MRGPPRSPSPPHHQLRVEHAGPDPVDADARPARRRHRVALDASPIPSRRTFSRLHDPAAHTALRAAAAAHVPGGADPTSDTARPALPTPPCAARGSSATPTSATAATPSAPITAAQTCEGRAVRRQQRHRRLSLGDGDNATSFCTARRAAAARARMPGRRRAGTSLHCGWWYHARHQRPDRERTVMLESTSHCPARYGLQHHGRVRHGCGVMTRQRADGEPCDPTSTQRRPERAKAATAMLRRDRRRARGHCGSLAASSPGLA